MYVSAVSLMNYLWVLDEHIKKFSFHFPQRYAEMKRLCEPNTKGILVGNHRYKSDQREVSTEDGQHLAEHLELPFLETSTVKGININECFDQIVDILLDEMERSKQLKELTRLVLPASGQELKQIEACSCVVL